MKKREGQEKSASLGYPTLEKLIEQEDPRMIDFEKSRIALNDLARKTSDAQTKTHVRQALLAYERFHNFFEEMIALREKMLIEKIEENAYLKQVEESSYKRRKK